MRPTLPPVLTMFLVGTIGSTSLAFAQTSSACSESEQATKAFDTGIRLLDQNLNRAALDAFQHSFDLSHCMRALAQIAFVERGLRRWADAAEHLRIALESDDPWIAERRDAFKEELRTIEDRLQKAGGRNEDSGESLTPASRAAGSRRGAGWGLLLAGLTVGSAAVGAMAVAQAFAGTGGFSNEGVWTQGQAIYKTTLPVGGVLLGIGGATVIAGATLLLLPRKEASRRTASLHLIGSGIAIAGSF